MRYMILLALVCAGCGDSPVAPERTYSAALTTFGLTVGQCSGPHCAFRITVSNSGPDCASNVAVGILVSMAFPPGVAALPAQAIGVTLPTLLRAGQSAELAGNDWPANNSGQFRAEATGLAVSCQ